MELDELETASHFVKYAVAAYAIQPITENAEARSVLPIAPCHVFCVCSVASTVFSGSVVPVTKHPDVKLAPCFAPCCLSLLLSALCLCFIVAGSHSGCQIES